MAVGLEKFRLFLVSWLMAPLRSEAQAAVQALALRVLADRLEHGEALPDTLLNVSFHAA